MRINSLSNRFFCTQSKNNVQHQNYNNYADNSLKKDVFVSNVSFGWCTTHCKRAEKVIEALNQDQLIKKFLQEQQQKANQLEAITQQSIHEAAHLITNYVDRMKGWAEYIPLWTIESFAIDKEMQKKDPSGSHTKQQTLQENLSQNAIFNNSIQNLIVMNNVDEMLEPDEHDDEFRQKADSSLKLHTYILLGELVEKNLEHSNLSDDDKKKVTELRNIVIDQVNNAYGEGTYEKVVEITKGLGDEPTLELKRAASTLLKDIDARGKAFSLGDDFKEKLAELAKSHGLQQLLEEDHHHEHHHHHIHSEHFHLHDEHGNHIIHKEVQLDADGNPIE